jgi:hypothetical protein
MGLPLLAEPAKTGLKKPTFAMFASVAARRLSAPMGKKHDAGMATD